MRRGGWKRRAFKTTVVVFAASIAVLALVKQTRLAFPQVVAGVHCYGEICTDDASRLSEERGLYAAAESQVVERVGAFRGRPRVVFCSTSKCARGFGLSAQAGLTLGRMGTVIAPRGWEQFYVAHEMIHRRQAEELGPFAALTKPSWLIEGMAYSLSDDPRRPLSSPFEQWRSQFEHWDATRRRADLWETAAQVR
jgi:hypothetical protein